MASDRTPWSRLGGLPLVVESHAFERRAATFAYGFERVTTVVRLRGRGAEGVGEDVSPFEGEDDTLHVAKPGLALAGEWTLEAFCDHLRTLEMWPVPPRYDAATRWRNWAFESAALDLALNQAGVPLHEAIGREPRPLTFVNSLGLGDPPTFDPIARRLDRHPTLRFKLDVTPAWSPELMRQVADTNAVEIVDFKGQYGIEYGELADLLAMYERAVETFPDALLEDHHDLPEVLAILEPHSHRISYDAPIHDAADVDARPFAPRAVNIKPCRVGDLRSLFEVYALIEERGLIAYGGGMGELDAGRGQIQLLASLFHPDGPNDTAPGGYNADTPAADLPGSPLPAAPAATGFRRVLTALLALVVALSVASAPAAEAKVAKPKLVRNIDTGETGWFASPGLVDLAGDRKLEIVAPFYSTFVYGADGRLLGKGTASEGRVYAPGVTADLDGDGTKEIVVGGNDGTVAAYNLTPQGLRTKPGWPASTCSGGQCPETRGLAAGDLDRDGRIEVVATTTNTSRTGAQVFAFTADGANAPGWPRSGGYGAYGENVGIGNLDRDPQLEVVATFDNHLIHLFEHDGSPVLASPFYRDRQSDDRLAWGDFIRWLSPKVEGDHYHRHSGEWPHVSWTSWLQWTASPPSIADLDRDGRNEVIGIPNVERHEPYETQAYAFMVLDGAYGNRSGRRHKGFTRLPLTSKPAPRADGDWYPPSGIPAPTIVNLGNGRRPEIVASIPDGHVYAIGPNGRRLWRFRYARGAAETFASEVVAADLDRDGRTELVFGTYGLAPRSGRLVILSAKGRRLHDIRLRDQGTNGNGIGVPAAPSIADVDRDGRLEIVLTTFDHGIDVYRVPRSDAKRLPWPTGRGNLLRNGS